MIPLIKEEIVHTRKQGKTDRRSEILKDAQLHYAPENELGVVFLFSTYAKKYRMKIEEIRHQFPDCIAYQKTGGGEKKIRIEFEFKSQNFKTHGHPAKGCDMIVCWEHNWPGVPEHITVVELRREYGLGFNVWIQPVGEEFKDTISEINSDECWSTSSLAHKDDLILFYHKSPEKMIKDIFRITGDIKTVHADYRPGMDYMGPIRRVCQLDGPIFFEDLKRDKILKTAAFVRGTMQGRPRATEYWPYLYNMILRRNSSLKTVLSKYNPENL